MNYGNDREISFIILMASLALKTDSFSPTTILPGVKNCIWFGIWMKQPCPTYTFNVQIVLNSSYVNTCLKIKERGRCNMLQTIGSFCNLLCTDIVQRQLSEIPGTDRVSSVNQIIQIMKHA